jgi:hypothetical protein
MQELNLHLKAYKTRALPFKLMKLHLVGIEPTTFCLSNKCSNLLSYKCFTKVVGLEPTTLILKTNVLPIKLYL